MAAVAESTFVRSLLHVVEGTGEAGAVEEGHLAQPGRVDDESIRERDELPPRRRVPAAGVVLADPGGRERARRPASALTSVDLPTPDEPMKATVRPGRKVSADRRRCRRR